MLHLLRTAIGPSLGLRQCLTRWSEISLGLREAKRRRTLQVDKLEQESLSLS